MQKNIDKIKKMLYYSQNLIKEVIFMKILLNLFFISFGINIFIIIYSVYSLVEILLLQDLQGSKLKFKKAQLN